MWKAAVSCKHWNSMMLRSFQCFLLYKAIEALFFGYSVRISSLWTKYTDIQIMLFAQYWIYYRNKYSDVFPSLFTFPFAVEFPKLICAFAILAELLLYQHWNAQFWVRIDLKCIECLSRFCLACACMQSMQWDRFSEMLKLSRDHFEVSIGFLTVRFPCHSHILNQPTNTFCHFDCWTHPFLFPSYFFLIQVVWLIYGHNFIV